MDKEETNRQAHPTRIPLFLISLESLIAFGFTLFSGSSEAERAFLFGFSLPRLILLLALLAISLCALVLTARAYRSSGFARAFSELLTRPSFEVASHFSFPATLALLVWSWLGLPGALATLSYRLQPFLWLLALVAGEALAFPYLTGKLTWGKTTACIDQFLHARAARIARTRLLLPLVLLAAAPLLLQNALRYALPVGYAGLYSLMSEKVAAAHFQLPGLLPYYGPGGVPFIYPPLAFYLAAALASLTHLSLLQYARFAGPLLYLACLAPFFLLTRRLFRSAWVAAVATFLLAFSTRSYLVHGTAAGMVRSLGLFFALLGLYFLCRAFENPSWPGLLLAGLAFGGAVLTHPVYALFFAAGAVALALAGVPAPCAPIHKRLLIAAGVALFAALLSMPWWLTILRRYSLEAFILAFTSQDHTSYLALLLNPTRLLSYSVTAFQPLTESPLLAGGALLGLLYALFSRRFTLPAWFLVAAWAARGYDFFLLPLSAMLAAWILVILGQAILAQRRGSLLAATAFVLVPLAISYAMAFQADAQVEPDISQATLNLAGWVAQNTPPDSTYLLVPQSVEEAEWFPYLLRRTPLVASWGSEWTGDFSRQLSLLNQIQDCRENASYTCLQKVIDAVGQRPDYLITDAAPPELVSALQQSSWRRVRAGSSLQVWQRANP